MQINGKQIVLQVLKKIEFLLLFSLNAAEQTFNITSTIQTMTFTLLYTLFVFYTLQKRTSIATHFKLLS